MNFEPLQALRRNRSFQYLLAVLIVASAAVVRGLLSRMAGDLPPHITFFPAVIICALFGGMEVGIFATCLSATAAAVFFMPQGHKFSVTHPHDIIDVGLFLLDGSLISIVSDKLRTSRIESAASRMSEQRFRMMAEGMPHIVWSANTAGAITYYNQRGREYAEPTADGAALQKLFLIHPDDREAVITARDRSLETGREFVVEARLLRSDGFYRWHLARGLAVRDEKGRITGWIGTATDTEDQKRAFEKVRESEEEFRAMFESTSVGIAQADPATGRLVRLNRTWRRIMGYAETELMDTTFPELTHPDDRQRDREGFSRLIRGEIEVYEVEKRLIRKDGEILWCYVTVNLLRDSEGRPVRTVAVLNDISERKRAEEALRRSKEQFRAAQEEYRSLAENSPDFIARHDRQYRHIYVNSRIAAFEGRDQQYFVGKTLEEIGFPAHRAKVWNGIFERVFASGKEESIEFSMPGPTGTRTIHRTLVPEFGADGTVQTVLAIGRDITERKEAENALRRERDKAQQYLDIAGALILALELDGTVNLINQKGSALLGFPEDEILGRNWFDQFIPEEERMKVKELFTQIVNGHMPPVEQFENAVLTRDRGTRLIAWHNSLVRDDEGNIAGVLSSGEDITDRRKAEDALRVSEKVAMERLSELQAIYDTAPVGLCVLDLDLRFVRLNKRMAEINGVSMEGHIGRTVGEVVPDLLAETEAAFEQILRTGLPLLDIEIHGQTPALPGVERTWQSRWFPLRNSDRQIIGVNIVTEEVTERRQAERELKTLNAELSKKLHEVSALTREQEAFIYSVSHDLREPLRSIASFSGLLSRQYSTALDEKASDYLSRVTAGAARMNGIIEDLLNLSRISRHEIIEQIVDLSGIAAAVFAELRDSQPDRTVAARIQPQVTAAADPGLMEITLSNLLRNAWKFTARTENACIEFGTTDRSGETVYYIRDNGAGFDPALSAKLFQPFQRLHADGDYEGTGIGLAIVERIVRLHGGSIWAESYSDAGAAFYFTLS